MPKGGKRKIWLEREVAEYWQKNSDLTSRDIGRKFNIDRMTVQKYFFRYTGVMFNVFKRNQRESMALALADADADAEEPSYLRDMGKMLRDREFHDACVMPPADVARDIEHNKGYGINLPPAEMARFVALHRLKKEQGCRVR